MKSCEVVFARELLTPDLAMELLPLLEEHKNEVSVFPDIPLSVDWKSYAMMQASGTLYLYTARANRRLIGYAIYIVSRHLHYNIVSAIQDVLFVRVKERKGPVGIKLISYSEKELAGIGVQTVAQHTKKRRDLSRLFERLGYQSMDSIMVKRLAR